MTFESGQFGRTEIEVGHGHVGPGFSQPLGQGRADAPSAAGYQGGAIIERKTI
jgi:hypothetical protein